MVEQIYDRVTEVITPFSGVEFVPEDILKSAGDRGTLVHKYIEGSLQGFKGSLTEEMGPYVDSFEKFWDSSKHVFGGGKIVLEKRLFCDVLGITGQADVIVETSDRTYMIDWKTSSRPQKSWALQGAAYRYLAEVNGYKHVDSVLFVKLNKTGKSPTLYKHENYEENISVFKKCLELFRWFDMKNTRKKWK
jgi:hypothetical protein